VRHQNGVGLQHRVDDAGARKEFSHVPSSRSSDSKQYTVTDGRTALGTVELISGAFVAIASTGEVVGSFNTLVAAARSFPAGGRDG
jgi:hypothetical protein